MFERNQMLKSSEDVKTFKKQNKNDGLLLTMRIDDLTNHANITKITETRVQGL